jgi:hypothetical protein
VATARLCTRNTTQCIRVVAIHNSPAAGYRRTLTGTKLVRRIIVQLIYFPLNCEGSFFKLNSTPLLAAGIAQSV